MKSAAVGRFFAHCNRKSLAAANTRSRFSASNTVLLTCVIGSPPCAHILPSHRFSLQWRTFVPADRSASAWPHAHSTVSCRPCGLLLLAYPARGRAESACITVSQYSVLQKEIVRRIPTDGKRALFPMDFCNPFIIIYDFSPFGKQILVTSLCSSGK